MPAYVPPHLRPGYKPASPPKPVEKRRGVHYKSNETGLPTHNLKVYRFAGIMANLPALNVGANAGRSAAASIVSKRLSRRTVKAKSGRKSALKSAKAKRTARQTKSASPKKTKRATMKAKSH